MAAFIPGASPPVVTRAILFNRLFTYWNRSRIEDNPMEIRIRLSKIKNQKCISRVELAVLFENHVTPYP
jgi:hypothetical protein